LRRRQRPGLSIVSWAHWQDSANRLDSLPMDSVLADWSRPCDTHERTIENSSVVSASQQSAVSCSGGASYHCVSDRIGSPRGFDEDNSSGKPVVLSACLLLCLYLSVYIGVCVCVCTRMPSSREATCRHFYRTVSVSWSVVRTDGPTQTLR